MTEILAPAGNGDCAKAAINAGADAVYLGLDKFSARSSAENFDSDKLAYICRYAHLFGTKVYAALNTVVKDSEIEDFIKTALTAWNTGCDALILQDIFLGKFLKQNFPDICLHLSTQAGTCNVYGAELAKKYGFDRVILARETKLSDIAEISKIIETEAFVQGALCTCFSGQCYMSSFIGGNSGNRGKCKQPCRKKYSIDRVGFEEGAYRLSLSDLCVDRRINEYLASGVKSFKIEGRMRRPEYVSASVSYYKKLLKGNSVNNEFSDLKRTFNRGNYTSGLAFGQDKSFISSAVQGHIGEYAGIIKVDSSKYILRTDKKLSAGDGFKILRGGVETGGAVLSGEVKGGYVLSSKSRLKNGDKAFITTDRALNEKLLSKKRLLNLNIEARFFAGQLPELNLNGKLFYGYKLLESATTRPLSKDDVIRCFEKVDGFPYRPVIDVETDGVFMPVSELNGLRRKVYSEYFAGNSTNVQYSFNLVIPEAVIKRNEKTAVISTDLTGLKADIGILKPQDYSLDFKIAESDFKGEKYLYIPPYLSNEGIKLIKNIIGSFDGIYCEAYYGIELANQLKTKLFAGTGFNLTNRLSLSLCEADYKCLSKELTIKEADALSDTKVFYLCEGDIKLMDLIYCPFEKKCKSCDRRELYHLTDENGRKFPLRRYKTEDCAFEVYNCATLLPVSVSAGKLSDFTAGGNCGAVTRGHTINGIY